jgi:ubiquinone/menaquinone biosynthesis C-methylase UbiE
MNEAKTWDRLARRYDQSVRLFNRSYPVVRARLRDHIEPTDRVLEIAAGTGQFTAALAERAAHLLATDIAPQMVAQLRAKLQGQANTTFRVMSAYALETEGAAFDAVFCANALHVMEHPTVALAEFHRVLRPEGRLIVPTFLHGVGPMRRCLSRALGLVSPFVAHTRLDLDGLSALVTEAGFQITHAEQLPGLFPLGYVVASRTNAPPGQHAP